MSEKTIQVKKRKRADWSLLELARKFEKEGVKGPTNLAADLDKYFYEFYKVEREILL